MVWASGMAFPSMMHPYMVTLLPHLVSPSNHFISSFIEIYRCSTCWSCHFYFFFKQFSFPGWRPALLDHNWPDCSDLQEQLWGRMPSWACQEHPAGWVFGVVLWNPWFWIMRLSPFLPTSVYLVWFLVSFILFVHSFILSYILISDVCQMMLLLSLIVLTLGTQLPSQPLAMEKFPSEDRLQQVVGQVLSYDL